MDKLTEPLNQAPFFSEQDNHALLYHCQDLEAFPSLSLDLALTVTNACAGSFFAWDEFQKGFILKAARGPYRERVHKAQVRLREGILGWIGMQGAPVLVKDIQADQRFQSVKRQGHYASYSFISVPLLVNHKLTGVINITERANLEPFSEMDLQRIKTLASYAALAYSRLKSQNQLVLENKNLHESLAKIKQEQMKDRHFVQLGKLAATLAHEVNNPMDAIRRYVHLAFEKSLDDSLTREYLGKAKKAIRRGIRIIHNLLEVASAKSSPRLVEAHELINQTLETFEEPVSSSIQIQKNFCAVPSYLSDLGVSVVLENLYRNSRQAMQESGVLTITTYRSEHTISIRVEDTGSGVAPVMQERLFQTIFSTKNQGEGTGIGLVLCRDIIERCGGTISCDQGTQTGARFTITLPCQEKGEN